LIMCVCISYVGAILFSKAVDGEVSKYNGYGRKVR
jgi:hypothetical protein